MAAVRARIHVAKQGLWWLAVLTLALWAAGCWAHGGARAPARKGLATVAVVSDHTRATADGKVVATVERGRRFGVIAHGAARVKVQICLGTTIRHGWLRRRDVEFLTNDDLDLATEALETAQRLNPKLDVGDYVAKLEALARRVRAAIGPGRSGREQARLIGTQLFKREGFAYAREVHRLDVVLDRKRGNCLGLSVLYVCVARRLGLPLHLVVAPRHAFVRYDDGHERFNIETTRRGASFYGDGFVRQSLGCLRRRHAAGIDLENLPDARVVGVLRAVQANALARRGSYAAACEQYARAAEINPRLFGTYLWWGHALGRMGRHAEACEKHAVAARIDARDPAAYVGWGAALLRLGKAAEAGHKFARAVDLEPHNARLYLHWASALDAMGRRAAANDRLAKAVELDPAAACRVFAQAAKRRPRDPRAHLYWGYALARMRQHAQACEEYRTAVRLDPRCADAYDKWSVSLAWAGKRAESYDAWATALELRGRQAEAAQKRAKAAELRKTAGRPPAAVPQSRQPSDAKSHNRLGDQLASTGEYQAACKHYAKAVELAPQYAVAYFNWGVALACLGRDAEAIGKLRRAAELDPTLRPRVEAVVRELVAAPQKE